ncbi:MAG TPA: zinc-ribbon domain-containing protein [Syntrophobacteraceae bacterium]|nr:zinc-ribbon domain-containing protein [Syntrophobacteraceae bacterium]
MKFFCPGCRVTFSVPDEKIPAGKELKILCPKCRMPVEKKEEPQQEGGPEKDGAEPFPSYASAELDAQEEDSSFLEVVEDGVKTALLCLSDPSRTEQVEQMLRQSEFYVSTATSVPMALGKLRSNHYDLLVLDDKQQGSGPVGNPLLYHIQLLPMHVRRQFFLCLLSESLPTMDRLTAFRQGVDLILNVKDLDKAKILLVRSMRDHEGFYKVFNDELGRRGQR